MLWVTGATAVSIDISQKLGQALPVFLVMVVGLAFVVLVRWCSGRCWCLSSACSASC